MKCRLALVLVVLLSVFSSLYGEDTYIITESQLTELEKNSQEQKNQITKLQNDLMTQQILVQDLKKQLEESKKESQNLEKQLQKTKTSLTKYENKKLSDTVLIALTTLCVGAGIGFVGGIAVFSNIP